MINLTIENLQRLYAGQQLTPRSLVQELLTKCENDDSAIWIRLLTKEELEPYLQNLENGRREDLPLYGIPFAIKDNIDLATIPTTAGCPEYLYVPEKSAFVVERLIAAGAIPMGKTNLDQFATGLVGTRSPFGVCKNSFNPDYISGGSSSGSSVAVAKGLCTFALGTDTAGSGRVPAAFNNILGVKPTKGLLSTRGVVPACRSLDCVSIFSLCAADARKIIDIAACYDEQEPYSRRKPSSSKNSTVSNKFSFGVPKKEQLQFFGNSEFKKAFDSSVELLVSLGGKRMEIDFSPFLDAAKLLYHGPWVEERTWAVGGFFSKNPEAGHPITRQIICGGSSQSAIDLFKAQYDLQTLKQKADTIIEGVDFLVTPTAGTCYPIAEELVNPIVLNTNLGYYTNYMNLLDYCSLAVPTALTPTVPFGVTLVAQSFQDDYLLEMGAKLHQRSGLFMGTGSELPPPLDNVQKQNDNEILLAVCGAHLKNLPLHHQLVDLDAKFVKKTFTADCYRMFSLKTSPPKPGLIRDCSMGKQQEVEIYTLSATAFGKFTAAIPHPLGIGKLELIDSTWVSGFIAEPVICTDSTEITPFGGWRAYLASSAE